MGSYDTFKVFNFLNSFLVETLLYLLFITRENVSWASTCNTAGVSAGWFVSNVLFLVFQSNDFSNKYFRPVFGLSEQAYGLVTIDGDSFNNIYQI